MNIVLIGPRGCGKTTIGAQLARRLDAPFIDLDEVTRARFGDLTVTEIFHAHGEPAWREAESRAALDVLRVDRQVIAFGGGTPMIPAVRKTLEGAHGAGSCLVIYLRATSAVLAGRLRQTPGDRPSLTGGEVAVEIAAVLAERDPVYERLAETVVDVGTMGVTEATDRIREIVEPGWSGSPGGPTAR